MKLTKNQLRTLIKEEMGHRRRQMLAEVVRRLDEANPGSNVGSYLKAGITKMWEADNLFQKALAEADEGPAWNVINDLHKTLEHLTFKFDGKMQQVMATTRGRQ